MGRHHAKLLEDSKIMLEDIKYLPLARQRTKVKKWEKIHFKYLCLYYARSSALFVSSFVTEIILVALLSLAPRNSSRYCHLKKT